jgi:hypothetical protein
VKEATMPEQDSAKPDASQAVDTEGRKAGDAAPQVEPQPEPQSEPQHTLTDEAAEADTPLAMKAAALIGNNKGKLAIGAAAMLGIAVFYKWRDSKLAKEDPEEFARLRRIKAGLGGDMNAVEVKRTETDKND